MKAAVSIDTLVSVMDSYLGRSRCRCDCRSGGCGCDWCDYVNGAASDDDVGGDGDDGGANVIGDSGVVSLPYAQFM